MSQFGRNPASILRKIDWPILILLGMTAVGILLAIFNQSTLAAQPTVDSMHHGMAQASAAPTSYFLLLIVGLTTGMSHCVGMCGPLVIAFTTRRQARDTTPLALYQIGRILTYAALGFAIGLIGQTLHIAAIPPFWQAIFASLLGGLLFLSGVALWEKRPSPSWLSKTPIIGHISKATRKLLNTNHPAAPFLLGISNGLLPCGAVYAMLLIAATTGSPLRGATVMFVFGLGTLPAMFGLPWLIKRLTQRSRVTFFRFAAFAIMLIGLQIMLRGLAAANLLPHLHIGNFMIW